MMRSRMMLAMPLAGGMALQLAAYWPGIMTWDAIRQYGEAVSAEYDDWHPPAMAWLWRMLSPFGHGPAPMLLVQTLLYWGGYALLVGWAAKARRNLLAWGLALGALLPFAVALDGAVLKDCLMAGMLVTAAGLLAWINDGRRHAARIVAVALLLFATTLRFNAFLAALPLLVALLPTHWRSTPRRMAGATMLAALPLLLALPTANALLRAKPSGVGLSLVIFDLAGITEHSGVDVFPPLGITDPVAVNEQCYSAELWDNYAWWDDAPCPIGFEHIRATLSARHQSPYRLWMAAILTHPIAYAHHRLAHFNISARFLVRSSIQRPVPDQTDPNPWNYHLPPNRLRVLIDRAARWSTVTPLGWPIWWMALAAGTLMLAPGLRTRRLVVPLALSALAYGFGYLVVGVASELRYHLWTMIAALIATVLTAADLTENIPTDRRRITFAAAPVVLVTIVGTAWRLTG